ncbi:MAG: hypothetical protein ABDH49_02005 [Candidatus Hydrothermales bacterium]
MNNVYKANTPTATIMVKRPQPKKWGKTFGGGRNDHGFSIIQTKDGGYVVTGCIIRAGIVHEPNVLVLRLDKDFNKLWEKTLTL